VPLPLRSIRLPGMLHAFDVDCGDDVLPGHRLVVRGLADHGRSRDDLTSRDHSGNVECQMVALVFELVPGVTAAEEAAREPGTPFTVDATYGADVPLPWSTGGSGPTGLGGPGSHESYDEVRWGGESTVGESGPWPVPAGARRLTFWVRGPDHQHPTGTVTVDLGTGSAVWAPLTT
jgi:hypothetical protein